MTLRPEVRARLLRLAAELVERAGKYAIDAGAGYAEDLNKLSSLAYSWREMADALDREEGG